MSRLRAVSIAVILSAFLIAPAIASAADEMYPQEQPVDSPAVDQMTPDEQPMDTAAELVNPDEQPVAPPVLGEVQAPAPTPKAAIDWNQMEAARRDTRDRAQALRQQTILEETQVQPAQ